VSGSPPGGTPRGLRGAARGLGSALLELLHTRLSLASVEFDEMRARALDRLVVVVVAVIAFAFALVGVSALVVVAFWDTNRIAALCGVVLVYLALGFIALWRLSLLGKDAAPPFAETIAQFERDRAWLSGKPGPDK
jgi:uncharacterized membrane protein YqjE